MDGGVGVARGSRAMHDHHVRVKVTAVIASSLAVVSTGGRTGRGGRGRVTVTPTH